MDLGLKGKRALVTAASRGLGYAAAAAIAGEGAETVICARGKKAVAEAAARLRDRTGSRVTGIVADVSREADLRLLRRKVAKLYGAPDILVCNAGGPPRGGVLTLTEAEWRKAFNLTLLSAVRLIRGFLPGMLSRRWGRIITITSVAAKQPINDLLLSSVLRPGIQGLSKVLSNQHAAANVTVNTVCPGYVLTARQRELFEGRAHSSGLSMNRLMKQLTADIPAARMGRPEEIGDVIAFLASERASYINGVNLLVDGGYARGTH